MTQDGAIIFFIFGTLTLFILAITLIIFFIVHKKKQYRHLLEKQQMENNYQNQLLLSRLEVQEQSFRYFSEEIHDNIGQLLSMVKLQLYNIRNNSREQETVKKATDSTNLLAKAITDLRNISHALNSSFVDMVGLEDAIQKDLEYIRSAKDIRCGVYKTGDEYTLGAEKELLIFRIVQEAVNNAIKHASPSCIDIYLNYMTDTFVVTIKDDGVGFDPQTASHDGLGLSNMLMRANLLNGRLEVSSAERKGTELILTIDAPAGNKQRTNNEQSDII